MTTAVATPRRASVWPRPVTAPYGALWACTAAGAALTAAGVELTTGTPHDALPARPDVAVDLLVHNALVALWPLALIALGWAAIPVARTVADALIAGHLAGHGLLVGNALAAHPDTWRYLPHLPAEWLALSLPVAAWLAARRDGRAPVPRTLALTVGLLVVAAVVETYAVPI